MKSLIKNVLFTFLAATLLATPLAYAEEDCLAYAQEEMNELHRTGACCEDAVFTSITSSMLGWGFGLVAGIALLTGLVHNSHAETKTTSDSSK
ncbi:MAG: hypothetical protein K940chlam2_01673 [Chlamydiae bacterium]|nr:hypothetical protein [Chlamydiota bacterium]